MIRKSMYPLFAVLILVFCAGCGNTLIPMPDEPCSSFWEATKDGVSIHVLGTVHYGTKEMYPLNPTIMEAFNSAEVLLCEGIKPSRHGNKSYEEVFDDHTLLKDGKTIMSYLSDFEFNMVNKFLADNGLSINTFFKSKPGYLTYELFEIKMALYGIYKSWGVDYYLKRLASKQEKEILHLEKPKTFFKAVVDNPHHLKELKRVIYSLESDVDVRSIIDIINIWDKSSLGYYQDFFISPRKNDRDHIRYKKDLLDNRNRKMIDHTEELIRNRPETVNYFMICGGLHLFGQKGLLDILDDEGYTVSKIDIDRCLVGSVAMKIKKKAIKAEQEDDTDLDFFLEDDLDL